jgi:hypothetical protein
MTAYFGSELAAPKAGETVFVSGAAGAVGSIVGQLFKVGCDALRPRQGRRGWLRCAAVAACCALLTGSRILLPAHAAGIEGSLLRRSRDR